MKFLSIIIDKLQETFPPNRLMLLLAGPIVAAAAWVSAFVTANVPGVELPVGIVAGVIGAAVLIVITLIYQWFDQWRAGEPINVAADLEHAFEEIVDSHQTIDQLLGTAAGIGTALEDLHDRLEKGQVNEAEISDELAVIADTASAIVRRHVPADQKEPPEAEVTSSTGAAPPTATETS